MSNFKTFLLFHIVWHLAVFVGIVISLDSQSANSSPAKVSNLNLNADSSHEDIHSQYGHSSPPLNHIGKDTNVTIQNAANSKPTLDPVKKIQLNTNKTHPLNTTLKDVNSTQGGNIIQIETEGGTIDLSAPPKKLIGPQNTLESSTPQHSSSIVTHQITIPKKSEQKTNSSSSPSPIHLHKEGEGTTEKPKLKRIHGRPGVLPPPSLTATSTSKPKKPLFTMITGDKETKESESIIESPTTGRDYVVPIVLIILSLPVIGYIIRLIYKRGTEFTERQQYHRMYLIDGMYNSR